MTFLDLCAGFGGFSLGLEAAGMICKGQVEIDDYCTRVLAKHWPHVPRWGDIKTVSPSCLPAVDLIAGGYPCQPFSNAGKRKGAADDRHLWPFILKIVAHIRPAWCLFENVAGHITMGLDQVLSDLESEGYAAIPLDVPACGVDAPHIRRRVWILAYSERTQRRESESGGNVAYWQTPERQETAGRLGTSGAAGGKRILAHTESARIRRETGDVSCPHGRPDEQMPFEPDSASSRCQEGLLADAESGGIRPGLCPDEPGTQRGRRPCDGGCESGGLSSDSDGINGDNAGFGASQVPFIRPAQGSPWGAIQGHGLSEPGLGRSHDGLSGRLESMRQAWQDGSWEEGIPRTVPPRTLNRVARCTGIGNAVVPYLPMVFGRFIKAAHYGATSWLM